jgi:hypothetical protein
MSGYNKTKMIDEMTKNIVEDPSIYDYDSFVDDYKEKRQAI